MSFEQKDHDLISDYIQNNLTGEDKERFERRMELEEDLNKEVQLHIGVSLSLKDEGWVNWSHKNNQPAIAKIRDSRRSKDVLDLEAKIGAVSDNYFESNTSSKKNNYRKYFLSLAAAAVVCFLLVRIFTVNSSPLELYNTHVDWNQNLISRIEQSKSTSDAGQIGESLFKSGDYDKSKAIFSTIIGEEETPDSHSLMYLGASYLELGQYDEALQIFDKLLQQNTLDSNRGYWYRAMVFLRKGDTDAVANELKVLTSNPKNYNYSQALELLTELKY